MNKALLSLTLMSIPTFALAQTPAAEPETVAETVQGMADQTSRMSVAVMINGTGPYRFIVDTGSNRSVVSRELADRLGLPEAAKATLHSMGGARDITTVKIDRLQVSSNVLKHVSAPALPARYIGADGILGIDALKNQRILLDFDKQTMAVEPGNTKEVREEKDASGTIIVTAKNRLGQLVLVDADANGEGVWVVVDTGGQNSVGNTPLRRLMQKTTTSTGFRPIEMISVVGDRIPADYTIVGQMRIGGIKLMNSAVAFTDAHPFKLFGLQKKPSMLMGMTGLRAFRRVSIDFANRKVKFQMPAGASVNAAQK